MGGWLGAAAWLAVASWFAFGSTDVIDVPGVRWVGGEPAIGKQVVQFVAGNGFISGGLRKGQAVSMIR